MLRNSLQHDLNVQQKVSIIYDGISVTMRKIHESEGPMMKKDPTTIKELIEECTKYSQEYHNRREDVTKGKQSLHRRNGSLAVVLEKLDNMDWRITKLDNAFMLYK